MRLELSSKSQIELDSTSTLMMAIFLGTILSLFTCFAFTSGEEYLKVKPNFLVSCHLHGTVDDQCLSTALQNLFTNWRDGIPGLKGVGPIDPFQVKKLRLAQKTENGADIQLELRDLVTTGLSKVKLLKSSINERDYTFKFYIHLPRIQMEGKYKVKGRISVLNLDGQGTAKTEMRDLYYSTTAKAKLRQVGDESFFDIVSISSNIDKIGAFHMETTNLFGGNKELEDSANQLFNDGWREIFEIMRPAITETFDTVLFDRYKKIFNYIPARYFFVDLP